MIEEAICSRPCKTGRPCRRKAFPWHDDYDRIGLTLPNPASCVAHLTAEERAHLDAARVRYRRAVEEYHANRAPACWAWPVPENPIEDARAAAIAEMAVLGFTLTFSDDLAAGDALRDWHAGRCAICGTSPHEGTVEDHDHITGLVRGRLCRGCNTSEGMSHTGRLAMYRQRPPAVILGIRLRYCSPLTGYANPRATEIGEQLDSSPIHALAAKLAA